MKKLRQRLLILLTLFIVVLGIGGWVVLISFFPQHVFHDYLLIPLFFFIVGGVTIYTLTEIKTGKANKLFNTFMMIRGIKMLSTLIIVFVYKLVNQAYIKSFAITLVVFYLLYLAFEGYIYIQLEKWSKKNLAPTNKTEEQ